MFKKPTSAGRRHPAAADVPVQPGHAGPPLAAVAHLFPNALDVHAGDVVVVQVVVGGALDSAATAPEKL